MFGRHKEIPTVEAPLSRERIIAEAVQHRLTGLQNATMEHNLARIERVLTPPEPSKHKIVRSLDMLGDMIEGEALTVGMVDRVLVDVAAKIIVDSAYEHPDESTRSSFKHVVEKSLDRWQDEEMFKTEEEIYNTHRTPGMTKPEKPQRLLKNLAEDATIGWVFKTVEDHLLGNFLQVHISKNPLLNQLLEYGLDTGVTELVRKFIHRQEELFYKSVAGEVARNHPEDITPRVKDLANHAYDKITGSSHPLKDKLDAAVA